jgi:hypothetical protein
VSETVIHRFPRLAFADLPPAEQRRIVIAAIRQEIQKLRVLKELNLAPTNIAIILEALLCLIESPPEQK